MKKDRNRLGVLTCVVLVCIWMWGCPANHTPADGQTAAAKEQPMKHDSAAVKLQPAVPIIDTKIPAQFDTATFGLG
jgi:hypothetical protein